jgi:23S rRNA pseudouridine1911/1915/1917 synthase
MPRRPAGRSETPKRRPSRSSLPIEVLYQDEAVIAINKPAGLAAVPVKELDVPSALSLIRSGLRRGGREVFVVHRIDRFTSGVMLFAATEKDRDALIRQFLSHAPVRQYLAVVRGHLSAAEGTLVHYFRREGMFQKLTSEGDPRGARAELRYRVERSLAGASLLLVTLVTGLQNQIRVQFSAIGHVVVGDRKYDPNEATERRIDRVALHALHLQFTHPRSGEAVSVDCDPPADFQGLLRALRPRP